MRCLRRSVTSGHQAASDGVDLRSRQMTCTPAAAIGAITAGVTGRVAQRYRSNRSGSIRMAIVLASCSPPPSSIGRSTNVRTRSFREHDRSGVHHSWSPLILAGDSDERIARLFWTDDGAEG